jgi:SAM-dependent methyltransferase
MPTSFQDMFLWGMSRIIPTIAPLPVGPVLNLGAGNKPLPFETINLDLPEWDARSDDIPFPSDSVAGVYAFHFLEHLDGEIVIRVLKECQRVLKPGGSINIVVPYYNTNLQAHDLNHKSRFCEETWRNLLCDRSYDHGGADWRLIIGFNVICGIVERNICLMTQLVRTAG